MRFTDIIQRLAAKYCLLAKSARTDPQIYDVQLSFFSDAPPQDHFLYIIDPGRERPAAPAVTTANVIIAQTDGQPLPEPLGNFAVITAGADEIYSEVKSYLYGELELLQYIRELEHCLTLGDYLSPLFDVLFRALQNPIMVLGNDHMILQERHSDPVTNKVWQTDLELGHHDFEAIDEYFHGVMAGLFKTQAPFTAVIDGERCILCTIRSLNSITGFIAVLEHYRDVTDNDLQLLRCAASIIGAKEEKNAQTGAKNHLAYTRILADLIDGVIRRPETLRNRMKTRNWQISGRYRLAVIPAGSGRRRSEISEYLSYGPERSHILVHDGHIVLLLNEESHPEPDISEWLVSYIRKSGLRIGISDVFEDLLDTARHYRQACNSVALALLYQDPQSVCYYRQYRLHDFLRVCCHADLFNDYVHPALLVLQTYDREHNSQLTETLYSYLNNDKSIKKTCEDMHLHKNTVNYRINRAKEILNVDFSDARELFHLSLSLKILRIQKLLADTELTFL